MANRHGHFTESDSNNSSGEGQMKTYSQILQSLDQANQTWDWDKSLSPILFSARHADNCCEARALCQILYLYDKKAKKKGPCSVEKLARSYGKTITKEELSEHLKAVEKFFHLDNTYMSQMFSLVLDRIDTDYFRALFITCIESNGTLMHLYAHMGGTSKLPSLFYGDAHESNMPKKELILLESTLLLGAIPFDTTSNDTLLDPYAGYATSLNSVFMNAKTQLFFQDKDPIAIGMANAYSIICHTNLGGTWCGNSLNGIFDDKKKYHKIIINRTFSKEDLDAIHESVQLNPDALRVLSSAEMIPFAQAIHYLNSTGEAIVLCSTSTLYKKASKVKDARHLLLVMGCIKAIIELPSLFLNNPGDNAALVILRKPINHSYDEYQAESDFPIKMIDGNVYAKQLGIMNPNISTAGKKADMGISLNGFIEKLAELYHKKHHGDWEETYIRTVTEKDIMASDDNLLPSRYMQAPEPRNASLDESYDSAKNILLRWEKTMKELHDDHKSFLDVASKLLYGSPDDETKREYTNIQDDEGNN